MNVYSKTKRFSGIACMVLTLCTGRICAQQVFHVSVTGNDRNKGRAGEPLRTISAAATLARPGDTITVHAGVYRELVQPPRGGSSDTKRITYRAAPGEEAVIKGSERVKGWKRGAGNCWRLVLHDRFFGGYNPFKDLVYGDWFFPGDNKVHTGEVYLNGQPLQELSSVSRPMTWHTQSKGDSTEIIAHFGTADPNIEDVEINVRKACFYPAIPGINYITLQGFRLSQAATQWAAPTAEQAGLVGTHWSKGWIIERNIISDSKCAGITLGKDRASGHNLWLADMTRDGADHYNEMIERIIASGWNKETIGSHIVRQNTVMRCGAAGICGSLGAIYSQILGNTISDIYTYRNFYGAEMAGIKFHGAVNTLIKGNRVSNAFIGIWLDWMTQGTIVAENILYDNDYVDFFPEVNHGPYYVEKNYFLSDRSLRDWSEGGVYERNLFAGLISRAPQERATPLFKKGTLQIERVYPVKGGNNRFINNVFMAGKKALQPRPKMHAMDEEDELIGYGLSVYDGATLPVEATGNHYLKGALPFAREH